MKRTASKRPQFLATRQWNYIVTSFQDQVPMKPVRHRLKLYVSCFTGTQAVAWLKQFFLESGGYGSITTAQVEKFCQKLLEMGIIVDATRLSKGNRKYSESSSRPFAHGPHPYCLAELAQQARVARKAAEGVESKRLPLRRAESVKSTRSAGSGGGGVRPVAVNVSLNNSRSSLHSSTSTGLIVRRTSSVPSAIDNRIVPPLPPARPCSSPAFHGSAAMDALQRGDAVDQWSAAAAAGAGRCANGDVEPYRVLRKTMENQSMVAVGSLDDVIDMLNDEDDDDGIRELCDDKENRATPTSSAMSSPPTSSSSSCAPPPSASSMQMSPPVWAASRSGAGVKRPSVATLASFPVAIGSCRADSSTGYSSDTCSRLSSSGSSTNSCIPGAVGHPPALAGPQQQQQQQQQQRQQQRRHTVDRTSVVRASQSLPFAQVAPPLPHRNDHHRQGLEASRSMMDQPLANHCCGHLKVCDSHRSCATSTQSRPSSVSGPEAFIRSSDTWKEVVLSRLLQCVEIPTLEAIIHCVLVDGNHIAVNCGFPAENGPTSFVPLSVLLEKRRRSWPSKAYPQIVSPLFECEWSGVHALCPRSSSGVNISYTPLICSAMDRLAFWPSTEAKTCCEFWLERGIEDIIPTIAQHFRRVVDGTVIPREFFPLFIAVHPLLAKKRSARSIEALQHCVLLLPPARRVLLERILVFLATCHENQKLVLAPAQDNIDVLLHALVPSLLQQKRDSFSKQAVDIIGFMAINVADIFKVPRGVIEEMQHCQCVENEDDLLSVDSGVHGGDPETTSASSVPPAPNISESSLLQLLDVIIIGAAMTDNEQRRRLKEFKKVYPNLYCKRFSIQPATSCTSCPEALEDHGQPNGSLAVKNKRRSSKTAKLKFTSLRLNRSFKLTSAFPRPR